MEDKMIKGDINKDGVIERIGYEGQKEENLDQRGI